MNRSDLVIQLSEKFPQLPKQDVEQATTLILDALARAVERGHRIEVRGFGSFTVRTYPPRKGRNPRTGESVVIPAKRVIHFKVGKALRASVDLGCDTSQL